jgi:glycosyltransferase involved in cell wall biosynthesis
MNIVADTHPATGSRSTLRQGTMPLVAVVTPCYNGGKYLAKTMASVQAQTYPNIVHIILNNASTDNSAEVIAANSRGPVKVLVYNNEAILPLPLNWSKAFSYLPEDAVYAKLMCADDLMRSDAIEKFVQLAESDPQIEVIMSQDVFADEVHRANLPENQMIFDGKTVARSLLQGTSGWMLYHHFFVRIHPEDRGEHFCANEWSPDPHVVLRSALRGKFGYIHEPLAYNRYHDESVTGKEINGRGVKFQLVHLVLMLAFGKQTFGMDDQGRREYEKAMDGYLGVMARFVVRWRLMGEAPRSKELRESLAAYGQPLSIWDYIKNIAMWPVNSVRWRMLTAPIGPHIDEKAFVEMRSPPLSIKR